MKFKSDIEVQAGLKDSSGSAGSPGLLLSSSSLGVEWVTTASALGYTPADDLDVVHITGDETISGNKTFTGSTLFNASAISGRETILTASVSDNATDKFLIANGTTTSARFIPTFVGYTGGAYQSLLFRGLGTLANDLVGTAPYVQFLAANTSSPTDPNNGVLTASAARRLFSWGTVNNDYLTLTASGNLLIGTTIDNGSDLQVSGTATFSSSVTANGFTSKNTSSGFSFFDIESNRVSGNLGGIRYLKTGDAFPSVELNNVIGSKFNISVGDGTTNPIEAFNINLNRAATFSSSVTAASAAIGTTIGASTLEIQTNPSALSLNLRNRSTNDFANISFSQFDGTTYNAAIGWASNRLRFMTGGLGDAFERFSISSAGAATFSSSVTATNGFFSGNLGVGITNPSAKFHIQDTNGGLFFNGTDLNYNRFKSTTVSATNGKDLLFSAQNSGTSPDIYIKNNGNVLIGSTTDNGSKLQVNGAATFSSSVTATDGIFSGNVGIGTTNPTRKLSVQSQYAEMVLKSTALSGAVGGSTLYFGNATSDSEAWINHDNGTKELSFRVNSINALQLNSTAAATFASSVSANGNIDTTKANPVVEAISTGASTNRTRLAVATTVGAFVGTSQVGDSVISATSNLIISTNNTQRLYVAASGTVAIENELIVTGSISAGGAVRVGNSTSLASASTVGQIRYRTSGTNSYMDMAMQIGASTYAWVNIVENNWA